MHKGVKRFISGSLLLAGTLACFTLVHASNTGQPADTVTSKDIITILFGLLQTVFMGIGVWLIANDRELFNRIRIVETKVQVRDELCDERHEGGAHPYRRKTDSPA